MQSPWLTCILFILLFTGNIASQNYLSTNYTMKEGMPSNAVRSIFKDSSGYLWIGTDAGLCRFDGKQFRIYGSEDGFEGNKIWSIAEDAENNMWFGDYGGGLWKYNRNHFTHYAEKDSLVNNAIRCLHFSIKSNALFVGTQKGISVLKEGSFTNFNHENLDHDPYVTGFVEDSNKVYIFTFTHNNFIYNDEKQTIERLPNEQQLLEGSAFGAFLSSSGSMLFSVRNSLNVVTEDGSFLQYSEPANSSINKDIGQVFGFAEDPYNNIWLASWEPNPINPGGLFMYDGEKVLRRNNILGKDPINGWSVYYDNEEKILWFGTLDMGLFKIQESMFRHFETEVFGIENLSVTDILKDNKGSLILLGKKNLIIQKANETNQIFSNELFYSAYKNYLKKIGGNDPDAIDFSSFLEKLEFNSMFMKNDSVLWISSNQGLFKVKLKDKKVSCFAQTGYGAGFPMSDLKGRICHANHWGYYTIYLDIENHDNQILQLNNPAWPKDISDYLYSNNELWLTSYSHGLFRGKDTIFENYNQSNSPIVNSANVICADQSGNLIVGANNGEVYFIRPASDTLNIFKTLDASDGLKGNSIVWMEVDQNSTLWIGTNTGLNSIDLDQLYTNDSLQIFVYDSKEGYLNPNVNVAYFEAPDKIWLGTDQELIALNTAEVNKTISGKRNIELNGYRINGQSQNQSIDFLNQLSYKQNFLQFEFDVINFINPDKDRFRFKMDGLHHEWSQYSERRQADFPYLQPGKYILRVEGKNLNTGKKYQPLEVIIHIRPPFWKTWWLKSLVVTLVLLLITAFFKDRIQKAKATERKKAEVSKQLAELEMKALLAQMNPHFTFNAINSIQNYILDNDVDKALTYLSEFSKIIRQTLENATKEFITLAEETEYMQRYLKLEQMRFDKQFDYQVNIADGINPETTQIPPMLIQPYVENAVKHGLRHKKTKGRLQIEFKQTHPEVLTCIIEDDGIGRKASEEVNHKNHQNHNGAGMAITHNRIKKLNDVYGGNLFTVRVEDLLNPDKQPAGTRITIRLPIKYLL